MDPTTAVRTDAIEVIATVIAPGAYASAPYMWAVLAQSHEWRDFLEKHEAIALASAILAWTVAGFVVESVGTYAEYYLIDRKRPDHAAMLANWWRYLQITWAKDKEPIGQHYLRRTLVSFKFELNMATACVGSMPGWLLLGLIGVLSGLQSIDVVILSWIAALGLFSMARTSAGVLAEVRERLLAVADEQAKNAITRSGGVF